MVRLTKGQRVALDALCRTIVPHAFEQPDTADLPVQVEARLAELPPHQAQRVALALTLFASRAFSIFISRATPAYNSIRRLILHTHYGRPEARKQIGHEGPLHEREVKYPWEGPLPTSGPVVATRSRDVVRERVVPSGVVEMQNDAAIRSIRTRVCIIGSGVGGATAAATLAEAGHDVVIAARILFETGAREVLTLHGRRTAMRGLADLGEIPAAMSRYGDPALFSAHVNGTCRMGGNASTSGCRPDGQVHGQPGLYVMDGSLLPTAPGVNPHETIAAVTVILASRLAESIR